MSGRGCDRHTQGVAGLPWKTKALEIGCNNFILVPLCVPVLRYTIREMTMKVAHLWRIALVAFSTIPFAAAESERIAWFGTWEGGLAEAQRSGKPIMLVSAAPHCHQVPGVW